ncbi:peroxisomal succinyl-coenzyme A thioesterase-like [Anguilla anguilla]|uniref:peroxisomal succinyl-coenzyme A thioesterase-like n=1 Tax=Anguilla anguilla TaxID=7936 RepID=UPI0015B01506|nr:peroxisomal succinyl-coenzyme A thioesterase-like [Anguilla anguilla]XP_035257642.1 peroxisomal succinyl-coenzyme A thioesterase-like [Anguilla anguilla]XP_035257643.1 peroxisomal succinyl-coenzyme A thioesterase-like [Anguilla anguilla]
MSGNNLLTVLSVRPSRGLVDEKFQVVVENLFPGQEVTLHSQMRSDDDDVWHAYGHYVSDDEGTVKVAEHVCVGGSYEGMEPMGLLWSMKPVPGSRTEVRLRKTDVSQPMVVHISVYHGHISQGFGEAGAVARVVAERWYMAPGVRRLDVTEGKVRGTLFLPPGPGPFPAILDMWGGGGGLVEYRSALLASHGYVSLALDYMSHKTMADLSVEVGNQYFEAAFAVLTEHPQVCRDRVAMYGLSFGTSVALAMAVYSPAVQPRCLVCVNGSHVQQEWGSLSDILKELAKNVHKTRYDEEQRVIWRDLLLPIPSDPSQKVAMGNLQCPLLLIVGEDDQNWPTLESAKDMEKMMEEAGNRHLLTVLSYPRAGHLIEPPYTPHVRSSNFMIAQSRKKVLVLWGGEVVAHSRAQEDSWRKTLAFLQQHLYGPDPEAPGGQ